MGKVYEFPNKQPFYEFLDELKEAYDEDLTRNFICIYSRDYRDGEEHGGFVARNVSYWFGESSTECLGLMDLMKWQIRDFIVEANAE